LHRCTNPELPDAERRALIKRMMQGRMALQKANTDAEFLEAKALVHAAKVALGERGPVWWDDDANDYSGCDLLDTPYADWWRSLS